MRKPFRTFILTVGLGVAPLCLSPMVMSAQSQNLDQKSYDTGYRHGVEDAQRNRPMNPRTDDDLRGDRQAAYQRGYERGYRSVSHNGNGQYGQYGNGQYGQYGRDRNHDGVPDSAEAGYPGNYGYGNNGYGGQYTGDTQHAYKKGYNRGVRDAEKHRGNNPNETEFTGAKLQAYRQGYEEGYRSSNGNYHH